MLNNRNVKKIACAAGAALIIVTATGCSVMPKQEQQLKPPLVKPVQEALNTVKVTKGTITETVEDVAQFKPKKLESEAFQLSGLKLKKIYVYAGDKVHKGELLADTVDNGLNLDLQRKQLAYDRAHQSFIDARSTEDAAHLKLLYEAAQIAKTELDQVKKVVAEHKLVAGMDGYVTYVKDMREGDPISQDDPIVIIGSKDMSLVYESVDQSKLQDVGIGMKVDLNYKNKDYNGSVLQIPYPQADATGSSVVFKMDNPPAGIKMGDFVNFKIIAKQKKNTLIIPKNALRNYLGRKYVEVLDGKSRKQVDVKVGLETETQVEILQGLTEGQKIILP